MRHEVAGARLMISRVLLGVAWPLLAVSLVLPALDAQALVVLPFDRAPVFLLVFAALLSLFHATTPSPYLVLIPGVITGAVAPWLSMPSPRLHTVRRGLSFGLLSPWIFWLVCRFALSPSQQSKWSVERFYWGFFVFALANLLAFLSVWVPPSVRRGDRRRGFTVAAEPANEPAHSPPKLSPAWSLLIDDAANLPASPPLARANEAPARPWLQRLFIVLAAAAVSALAAFLLWAFVIR